MAEQAAVAARSRPRVAHAQSRCSSSCSWSSLLAFAVFRYFFVTFVVAGSVALMLAPLQRYLTRRLRGRAWLAAGCW